MDIKDLTIGIEEEYQIVDPESRELTSYISEILDQGAVLFRDQVKPEFLQSQVETGSHICRNIKEARQEVRRLRGMVNDIAQRNNRRIVAAGTHPFSRWQDQIITDKERYKTLVKDMHLIARRLLIFGTHIHIGIPDKDLRIDVMNQAVYFMPHILTLSTSSPFWAGNYTGLNYIGPVDGHDINTLVKTNCIDEPTKIWWDIRPHPKFPTLEFRMCDCTTKIDEIIAIAALTQAVVARLIQLRERNQTWRIYRRGLIAENKWRAIKDGIDGKLIDFGREEEVPLRFLMEELLELVEPVVDELGTRQDIEYIRTLLDTGTSADRQLRRYQATESMESVVDMLIEETMEGC